jgi:type IV pilus assembly protein PilA
MKHKRLKVRLKPRGFTLLELLITLAIVVILALVAVSSYHSYIKKSHYQSIVVAADSYKKYVAACVKKQGGLSRCSNEGHTIPTELLHKEPHKLKSVVIDKGVIIMTPVVAKGISESDTYILTPHYDVKTKTIEWKPSGGACDADIVDCNQ